MRTGENNIRVRFSPYPAPLGESLLEIFLPADVVDTQTEVMVAAAHSSTTIQSLSPVYAESGPNDIFSAIVDLTTGGTWTITVTTQSPDISSLSDFFQVEVMEPTPTPPSLASDFELQNLSGENVTLQDYKNKAVILNFWATWCPPCRAEMPLLEETFRLYKSQDFVILGVNVEESEAEVSDYVEEMGLSFPILLDKSGEVADLYQARSFPTSVFISPQGHVLSRHIGELNHVILDRYLTEILELPPHEHDHSDEQEDSHQHEHSD
jgi:peroxiredoxin